jgi:hypothetical protein
MDAMSDDNDLFLLLLQRIGASDAVIEAARASRTDRNFVPVRDKQSVAADRRLFASLRSARPA